MNAVLPRSWVVQRHPSLPIIAALVLASACLSLFVPQASLVIAWAAVLRAASISPQLLPGPLLVFSHCGSLIFASRSFAGPSSDFTNYFAVFSEFCSFGGSAEEALRAFGLEIGLPAVYRVLSLTGGCGLTITGLAYLQGLLVSFATLWVMSTYAIASASDRTRPYAIGGLCLMYSFFFATQVSRQAASSVFLLAALFLAKRPRDVAINLALATFLHLTAPVIFLFAWALRRGTSRHLFLLAAIIVGVALFREQLLAFALSNIEAFEPLAKLAYYAGDLDSGAFSDVQSIVYLAVPGLAMTLVPRLRQHRGAAADARLLLGFALLGLALLPLPLATTRLTMAFGLLVQGYFIFTVLASASRPLAVAGLAALLALRIGLIGGSGNDEHALWTGYGQASWLPGYFMNSF